MTKAICAGTFDPITLGHVDIIERGLRIFDQLMIGVSHAQGKDPLFQLADRVAMIEETFAGRKEVEVAAFEGLLVDFATQHQVFTLLRGLRTFSDFEYEHRMADANRAMSDQVETLFMMTDGRFSHLSSSLIREIVGLGGSVRGMVPEAVERKLKERKRK